MSAILLKVYHGQTIRRTQLKENHKMNDLLQTVNALFPKLESDSYTLTYVDEDHDTITLSSDGELVAAVHLVRSMGWGKLQINIVPKKGFVGIKEEKPVVVVSKNNDMPKKSSVGVIKEVKPVVDVPKNNNNALPAVEQNVEVSEGEEETEPVKAALKSLGFDPNKSKVDVQIGDHTVNLFDGKKEKKNSEDGKKNAKVSKAPLTATSGGALIYPDGTVEFGMGGEAVLLPDGKTVSCALSYTGFPSVTASNTVLTEGKWYYEVILLTDGLMQIGWCDTKFEGNSNVGEGVGDDEHSIAYDGYRKLKWHNGRSAPFGKRWKTGDVVCCAADLENGTVKFALNGNWKDRVVAFDSLVFHDGLIPAASFSKGEKLCFNFGADAFVHGPPTMDYLPVYIAIGNKNVASQQKSIKKGKGLKAGNNAAKVHFDFGASSSNTRGWGQHNQDNDNNMFGGSSKKGKFGSGKPGFGAPPPPVPSASFVNNPFATPQPPSFSSDEDATKSSDPISPTEHLAALLLQDDVRDAIGRFLANPDVALTIQHIIVAVLTGSKDAMNAQFGNIIPLLIQLASEAPALLGLLPMMMDPTNFMGAFGCSRRPPPPHHHPHQNHQPYHNNLYGNGHFPAPPTGYEWGDRRGWRGSCARQNWRKQHRHERCPRKKGGWGNKCGWGNTCRPQSSWQQSAQKKEDESPVGTFGRMVSNVLNATGVSDVLESMVPNSDKNEKKFSSDLQKAITASLKEKQPVHEQKPPAYDAHMHEKKKACAAVAAAMAIRGKNVVVQAPKVKSKPVVTVGSKKPAVTTPSYTPPHLRPRAKFVEQFAVETDSLDNKNHVALTSLLPGEKVRHTWKMVNPSDTNTWPAGVVAKSVGGDDFVIQTKEWKPYNPLKPKEEVEIVVEAVAPTKPGRYIHYWRLHEPNGAPFGDRIWLDMTVVLNQKVALAKVEKKQVLSVPSPVIEEKKVAPVDALAKAEEEEVQKKKEVVTIPVVSARPSKEVEEEGKTHVHVETEKTNINVLDENEGEDAAVQAALDTLPTLKEELSDAVSTTSTTQSLSNPDQEWDLLHAGVFDDNTMTADSMIRLEKYKSELDTLSSMGFSDRDLLIKLLDEHNGNVQQVITSFMAKKQSD